MLAVQTNEIEKIAIFSVLSSKMDLRAEYKVYGVIAPVLRIALMKDNKLNPTFHNLLLDVNGRIRSKEN